MRRASIARRIAGMLFGASLLVEPAGVWAQDVHLKDIAHVQGVTANQLVGYGLVTA